jgi:N-acetylmuramoyl-L-alanine amidase
MTLSNKYQLERNYIKFGNARSGDQISKVRFLVAHEVGKISTADQNRTHFHNNQPSGSAHTFIDNKKILEMIPLWEKAYHVQYQKPIDNQLFGDDANDCAIGVELCRTSFQESYDRYVWYFAYLCRKFALDPRTKIVSHKKLDPQRRSDPESWLNPNGVTWTNFISHVTDYYNRWHEEPVVVAAKTTPADSADGKLVRGERGPNVQALNLMLKALEYTTKTDDLFDQYTEAALKVFQKQHGLVQDAVYTTAVGEVMLKAIAEKEAKVNVDPIPVKSPEMIRLAKLIDTKNPELMKKLKDEGYIIIAAPK